jgi:CRISPR/Cas system-associated endonuclease Cas3-HD
MEEKEILKEAMERIEFEIEDSLKNKQTTIAGRIDVEIVKHQLQAYKDKEDKLREYIDKEINQPFTSVYDYEQGARDNLCQELYKILNEGDKQFKKEKGMWVSNE